MVSVIDHVGTFFRWWGHELYGVLPAWMQGSDTVFAHGPVVAVESDGLRLLGASTTEEQSVDGARSGWKASQVLTLSEIAAALKSASRSRLAPQVILRIPFSYCFSRTVELPTAAATDFSRLLTLDMERATPFRTSDVYSAFVPNTRANAPASKSELTQFIVKRSLLSAVVSGIQAVGLEIGRIDCWNEAGTAALPLDFRPADEKRERKGGGLARAAGVLVALVALTAFSAAFIYLGRLETALADLESHATRLSAAQTNKRQVEADARATQATLASVETLSKATDSKLAVLDELTRLLPDDAWVSDLRVSSDGADLTGFATSTVALLPLLEKSPLFVDATSAAAVTFDARENKERFSIHVKFRPAAAGKDRTGGKG